MIQALIEQHAPRVALQFSGGRDSLALLLLLRPLWERLTVYHLTSGDAYPETRALVERVRAAVPRFVEVAGEQPQVLAARGWPTDLAPAGANFPLVEGLRAIDRFECCYLSIMRPLHQRMAADGMTLLLRGQRDEDHPKSPVKHGETVDGFTIAYPIAAWSTEEVETYIAAHGWELPSYYAAGMTSAPDCLHCTGWLEHNPLPYLRERHPAVAATVIERLRAIRVAAEPHFTRLVRATEEP